LKTSHEITYRTITDIPELHEAVQLQLTAWGQESVTSMPQMAAAILHGGVVVGAFESSRMVGFCYGFAGFNGHDVREAYLGSHMMAIHPDYRDRGIGMRLKLEQREWALQYGYTKIVWTFDPFETRNAYLNICKLGGTVSQYIPSFYGKDKMQLPQDRFVVEWDLASERVVSLIEQIEQLEAKGNNITYGTSSYPSALTCDRVGEHITEVRRSEVDLGSGNALGFLIPIPSTVRELKSEQPELFVNWQSELRLLCMEAFAYGYRVVSFIRDAGPVQYYVLEKLENNKCK
jgi:predicted GNAT superfamily acetyltransferase